jgi:hypothetical protein
VLTGEITDILNLDEHVIPANLFHIQLHPLSGWKSCWGLHPDIQGPGNSSCNSTLAMLLCLKAVSRDVVFSFCIRRCSFIPVYQHLVCMLIVEALIVLLLAAMLLLLAAMLLVVASFGPAPFSELGGRKEKGSSKRPKRKRCTPCFAYHQFISGFSSSVHRCQAKLKQVPARVLHPPPVWGAAAFRLFPFVLCYRSPFRRLRGAPNVRRRAVSPFAHRPAILPGRAHRGR